VHVLRYDDFSAASCSMVEEALVELLLRHRVPCTFAAIPFVCDPEELLHGGIVRLRPLSRQKAQILQPLLDAGLGEVALHGYAHLALSGLREQQEFSDAVPRETQRALISQGRAQLEDAFGAEVRVFVPPWNRLSPSTAALLRDEGFMVSGDVYS